MPTLPTLTVTQAQADRLLAAFGTTKAYKDWLKENLIQYVIDHESVTDFDNLRQSIAAKQTQLQTDLTSA